MAGEVEWLVRGLSSAVSAGRLEEALRGPRGANKKRNATFLSLSHSLSLSLSPCRPHRMLLSVCLPITPSEGELDRTAVFADTLLVAAAARHAPPPRHAAGHSGGGATSLAPPLAWAVRVSGSRKMARNGVWKGDRRASTWTGLQWMVRTGLWEDEAHGEDLGRRGEGVRCCPSERCAAGVGMHGRGVLS